MKKFNLKKMFLVSILSLAFSTVSMGASFITSSKDNAINIRESATTDSKVIETIKNGEILQSSKKEDFISHYTKEIGGAPSLEDIMVHIEREEVIL